MSNDFNLDENTMNNIKNMVDNGNLSDAISQISPDMIQNFSKILQNNSGSNHNSSSSFGSNYNMNYNQNNNLNSNSENISDNNNSEENRKNYGNNTSGPNNSSNNTGGFDFSNLDANTIMKITSVLGKMNNKNDPRANLLYSLKPYLREGRQDKLDQYVNLLNVSKVADILKDNQKENKND